MEHAPPLAERRLDTPDLPDLSRSKSLDDRRITQGTMQKISDALNQVGPPAAAGNMPASAQLSSLLSPCYLHRRFDDAVDIEKVLEEVAADEAMSHSRLVQTATGVREIARKLQRRPIKRAVRNVMIVTKARDNSLVTVTREVAQWLLSTPRYGSDVGVNVYVDEKLRRSSRFDAAELVSKEPRYAKMLRFWTADMCRTTPEKFDLVLTLGGDGTVLFTSWLFQRIVPPILSFSLGSLGFLTPFDFHDYRHELNRVMGGLDGLRATAPPTPTTGSSRDVLRSAGFASRSSTGASSPILSSPEVVPDAGMRVSLRMRFTCTVHRAARRYRATSIASSKAASTHLRISAAGPSPVPSQASSSSSSSNLLPPPQSPTSEQFEVLNEVVIDRGPSPYVSNLELFGDDTLLTVIQADGCIFSTPTGSTAYSLSAGGSLCDPSIPAILLTPICPHTLSFRPMLLNDTISLRVAVPRGSRAGAWCSFDGKGRIELRQGDSVAIRASRYPFASVVGAKGEGWIDSVSRTLRWNTREARQKGWNGGGTAGRRQRVASVSSGAAGAVVGAPTPPISEVAEEEVGDDVDGESETGDGLQEEFDIDFDDDDGGLSLRSGGSDIGYEGGTPATDSPASGSVTALERRLDKMAELRL